MPPCLATSANEGMILNVIGSLGHPATWSSDDFRNLAETAAVAGAAIFFLGKALAGFFVVNMSVSVSCERGALSEDEDWLAVTLEIEKGDRRSVAIHDLSVRATPHDGEPRQLRVGADFDQLASLPEAVDASRIADRTQRRVVWGSRSTTSRQLNITPGDKCTVGAMGRVPRAQAVLVETAVLGKPRWSWRWAQWRASAVALPTFPATEDDSGTEVLRSAP